MRSLTFILFALTLPGCEEEAPQAPGPVGQNLPNCARVETNAFASYRELPITDEGNGFIGVGTQEENSEGRTYQRYSMVNCVTKEVVRVEAEWQLGEITAASAAYTDVFGLIGSLRERSRLTNMPYLESEAAERGFSVSSGQLPASGDARVARSDCGCRTFYPDTMPQAEFILLE
jgi:hypothetical protein